MVVEEKVPVPAIQQRVDLAIRAVGDRQVEVSILVEIACRDAGQCSGGRDVTGGKGSVGSV